MQCNMELNEDKTQWHVSISSALLEALGQTCPLFPSGVWRGNGLVSASSLQYPELSCPLTIKEAQRTEPPSPTAEGQEDLDVFAWTSFNYASF